MKAGVYDDLSNMAYHAETDWVSSSMLKRLLPEHYGPPPKDQSALWFGSALHTSVLGGPSEPWWPVDFPTWQSKAAKEHAEEVLAHGQIPVLQRDADTIEAMTDAVKSHSEASTLLYGTEGRSELSVFAEVDSVPMKARFDRVGEDHRGKFAVDLKSTSAKPSSHDLARAVITYGYDLSMDHYRQVGEAAGIELDESYLIFVCKEPPHFVTVVDLHVDFWNRGAVLRDLALQRYLHPQFEPAYPGEREPVTLSLPRWAALD